MLRQHLHAFGTAPDGRLFRGARGGMLSESAYGRAWHAARQAALGPALAATALARRPYDLRPAALSLWLNASGAPAEVAARAGNSARVLQRSSCTAPTARTTPSASGSKTHSTQAPASRIRYQPGQRTVIRTVGTTQDPVRYMYVDLPADPPAAHKFIPQPTRARTADYPVTRPFRQLRRDYSALRATLGNGLIRPTHSPQTKADGLHNRSLSR